MRHNRRNQQAAQAAAGVNNGNNQNVLINGNPNREARNRLLNLKLTDLFDEKFFEDSRTEQKMKCITQLYESMFVSQGSISVTLFACYHILKQYDTSQTSLGAIQLNINSSFRLK